MGTLDSATEHLPTDGPVVIVTASYEGDKSHHIDFSQFILTNADV